MAESRSKHEWGIASTVLALIANCHRDTKKTRPFTPKDFFPFDRDESIIANSEEAFSVLKKVFGNDK